MWESQFPTKSPYISLKKHLMSPPALSYPKILESLCMPPLRCTVDLFRGPYSVECTPQNYSQHSERTWKP